MRSLWQWMHSRHCGENSVTTWSPGASDVDALADLLDHAGALVPEHRRRVAGRVSARGGVEIRVTYAARHETHEHFPSLRLVQLHLAHRERLPELFQYGSSHTHRGRTFS